METCQAQNHRHALAHAGSDGGGLRMIHLHGQNRAEDTSAVHGERGKHVEQGEADVDPHEIGREAAAHEAEAGRAGDFVSGGQKAEENQSQHDIDGRSGKGHQQFLPGILRDTFQAGDPSYRQEGDVAGADAETPGGEAVALFVQDDDAKKAEAETDATGCSRDVLVGEIFAQADPSQQHQEGGVNEDVNSRQPTDFPRPFHIEFNVSARSRRAGCKLVSMGGKRNEFERMRASRSGGIIAETVAGLATLRKVQACRKLLEIRRFHRVCLVCEVLTRTKVTEE